jgi:pilus assembly protein CpaB
VARTALPVGSVLTAESLRWQTWPANDIPVDYIVEGKGSPGAFAGAVVRTPLVAGEPVTPDEIAHIGDKSAMSAVLTAGARAITINVTPSNGMAGFLAPGDHVDVILTITIPPKDNKGNPRHVSQTVLNNVRVVGTDQALTQNKKTEVNAITPPRTVSIEVTPKQAETVAVAQDIGILTLALRSLAVPDGPTLVKGFSQTSDTTATHGVYGHGGEGGQRPIRPPGPRVWVIRGDHLTAAPAPAAAMPTGVTP